MMTKALLVASCAFYMASAGVEADGLNGPKPHFGMPPCLEDEAELEVKDYKSGYHGKACAVSCSSDADCPKDKPASSTTPACIIHDSGKKYCALACFIGCGNPAMTCLSLGAPNFRKACAYRGVDGAAGAAPEGNATLVV
mmetsp:Transcript_52385/g.140214  ORF Transcript_52385/g.140214 Transcript_52385/m.140214 type:complete len:140 (+) Transcript_52385:93-512(+)